MFLVEFVIIASEGEKEKQNFYFSTERRNFKVLRAKRAGPYNKTNEKGIRY